MPTRLNQNTITIANHIRDRLLQYKEASNCDNWDEFMENVLILIERDVEDESDQ